MTDGIKDCLPPDRNPRKPKVTLPKGSIDTHVHVFERARYKMNPDRGYNPPDSTLDDLKHLHKTLGVDRVVFTQPSTYGTDNSAILDGMKALNQETPGRARCVVAITMDISDKELAEQTEADRQWLIDFGVPAWFADRAYSTPTMWWPTSDELIRAGVITGVARSDDFALPGLGERTRPAIPGVPR